MVFQTCLGRGITIGSLRIGTAIQDMFSRRRTSHRNISTDDVFIITVSYVHNMNIHIRKAHKDSFLITPLYTELKP